MKKTYCDKCKTDLFVNYTMKIEGFQIRKDSYGNEVGGFLYRGKQEGYVSELHFCGECINDVSKIINNFLKEKREIKT